MFKKISLKKLLFALVLTAILSGLSFGVYKISTLYNSKNVLSSTSESSESQSAFTDLADFHTAVPVKLSIMARNLSAEVISVGQDAAGFMETPRQFNQAGWYRGSAKLGKPGNVVINGHYDDSSGRPAAFWLLKSVVLGDKVVVVDELNRPFLYQVSDVYYVSIDDPNRFKIFESEDGKESLTLITCGGVWVSAKSTYDKRLIVRAERID